MNNRQTLSADGSTTWTKFTGPVYVAITGGFGSGTVVIERLYDASPQAAVEIANTSSTAAADLLIDFPIKASHYLRATVSGSTTPTLVIDMTDSEPNPTT